MNVIIVRVDNKGNQTVLQTGSMRLAPARKIRDILQEEIATSDEWVLAPDDHRIGDVIKPVAYGGKRQ